MNNWKKSIGAVTSAALLASILTTSAFAAKGVAGDSDQTDVLNCTAAAVATLANCSQVADGISTVTLSAEAVTDATKSLYITASGATIISTSGTFVLAGGTVTGPATQTSASTITLRAPAAPGTATVSVYQITTATGISALEGTLTITFTATSGLAVDEAKSTVKIVDYDATPTAAECTAATAKTSGPANLVNNATLCVTVKDGNGNPVNAPMVAATITPVGLINGAQSSSGAADATGFRAFQIQGSTLAGVATIGISVTQGTKTTTFGPKTYTFTGVVSTITAASEVLAVKYNGGTADAVSFNAKDSAGNSVATTAATATSSDTTVLTTGAVTQYGGGKDDGLVSVTCVKVGAANVTVKQGAIASSAIKVYCSDVAYSFTAAFDKTTVPAGGSAKLTVTVLDKNSQPAVSSGNDVSVIVSSGAISPDKASIKNGATVHTFLAPFNVGTATALVTVVGITDSKSASISIGTAAPVAGSNGSALGARKTGPFTTPTKVSNLNGYQTWQLCYGAGSAGKTVGILVATKNSAGVWSSFTRLTSRTSDSLGCAYFWWRSSSAAWVSVRGDLNGGLTAAVQGRWR